MRVSELTNTAAIATTPQCAGHLNMQASPSDQQRGGKAPTQTTAGLFTMTCGRIVTIVMPCLIQLREWPGYRGVGSTASRADAPPNNAYCGSHQLRCLPCEAPFGRTYGLGVSPWPFLWSRHGKRLTLRRQTRDAFGHRSCPCSYNDTPLA